MAVMPDSNRDALTVALERSERLDDALMSAINASNFVPFDDSNRISASVAAACVALEHGRAHRLLIAQGFPTAAFGLLRLQHEALTRALWLLYAASDVAIEKLSAPLSAEAEAAAGKLPMLATMLKELEGKGPAPAMASLLAFKANNSAALNSFVHGGIHALQRHAQGYPLPLVITSLHHGNGLLLMTTMMLAVLAGSQDNVRRVSKLQIEHADILPAPLG